MRGGITSGSGSVKFSSGEFKNPSIDQLQGIVGYSMYTVGLDVIYSIANLISISFFSAIFLLVIGVLTYIKKIFFSCFISLYIQSVYITEFLVIYCLW